VGRPPRPFPILAPPFTTWLLQAIPPAQAFRPGQGHFRFPSADQFPGKSGKPGNFWETYRETFGKH
jgi:hypothetical protein